MNSSSFNFWNWLGGVIDGDGCFSLSLSKQHNPPSPRICVTPQVAITSRADYRWYLEYIQKQTGIGTVYTRGRSPYPMCAWQTTSMRDSLYIAERVFPYLIVKKEKAKKFIKVLKYWIETANPDRTGKLENKGRSRRGGARMRKQSDMLKIVKVACEINSDRQTRRYKDKLSYEDWVPLIKEWYPL